MEHVISKEEYRTLKSEWAKQNSHYAGEHVIYNILRGKPASLGFTPVKNENKLKNGARKWGSLYWAMVSARYRATAKPSESGAVVLQVTFYGVVLPRRFYELLSAAQDADLK